MVDKLESVNGWLLVYLIGSVPLLVFYSMGLSGWFFDYPLALMVAIFVLLAAPLVLVLLRSPGAPRWNIAGLWIIAGLMLLRSISVFLQDGGALRGEELAAVAITLGVIVSVTVVWAVVWTVYFKTSARVRRTFPTAVD